MTPVYSYNDGFRDIAIDIEVVPPIADSPNQHLLFFAKADNIEAVGSTPKQAAENWVSRYKIRQENMRSRIKQIANQLYDYPLTREQYEAMEA